MTTLNALCRAPVTVSFVNLYPTAILMFFSKTELLAKENIGHFDKINMIYN